MEHFFLEGEELLSYNYLIICHNIMLSLLKRADKNDWHNFKINIKENDEEIWKEHDIEYMRLHGYKNEINKMYYQHTFFSLLADYLNYTYEANIAASKMKVNIAYSLLRKPLKDNLYFIESLENKGIDFIDEFLSNPIEMYSVDKISVDDKRSLIDRVAKDVFCESFGEMLYNIRYSKKEEYGLERIWNQTQHIITTCPYYKTEDGNFNMIFNDDENLKEFITYFYNIMPIVQTYVCKLVLKILKQLELINEIEFIINNSIITNRYLMFSQKIENKELDDILNGTLLICPRCFKEIDNYKKNQEILSLWYLYCPYCKKKINLDRFIFYNLHKENGEYFRGRYKRRSKK